MLQKAFEDLERTKLDSIFQQDVDSIVVMSNQSCRESVLKMIRGQLIFCSRAMSSAQAAAAASPTTGSKAKSAPCRQYKGSWKCLDKIRRAITIHFVNMLTWHGCKITKHDLICLYSCQRHVCV